jgi:hypothetical protein
VLVGDCALDFGDLDFGEGLRLARLGVEERLFLPFASFEVVELWLSVDSAPELRRAGGMYFIFGASEGVFEPPSTLAIDPVAALDAISILDSQREQEE